MITINDVLNNRILPFEVDNTKLIRLFSFFLHSAPTISSKSAANIEQKRLINNWQRFIQNYTCNYSFISDHCHNSTFEKCLENTGLCAKSIINKNKKGFICKRKSLKNNPESEVECLLRHLRNSIAHSNVFMINAGNRYYILFDDYNLSGNQSARILFTQTHLNRLKKEIIK